MLIRLLSMPTSVKNHSQHISVPPTSLSVSSSAFSLFGVGASSFQSLRSPVLCFFYLYSFLLRVFSCNIRFGLPIFRCPLTSMFSLLHLLQSFYPHGLTISVSLLWSAVECRTRNQVRPHLNPLWYRFEDWAFSFSPLMPQLTQLYK